jgi:hypothetical protein
MCTEEQGWAALDKGCEMLKAEIHAKVRLTLLIGWAQRALPIAVDTRPARFASGDRM